MSESLAEALPKEMARVREVLGQYRAIMICPQTKRVCTAPTECGALGCVVVKNATPPPPPPTLAEIERSLDALGSTMYQEWCGHASKEDVAFARAAHLTIVQKYGAKNGQT